MGSRKSKNHNRKKSSLLFSFYPVLGVIIAITVWWMITDVQYPKFSKRASPRKSNVKSSSGSNPAKHSIDDYSKIDSTVCLLGKKRCEVPEEYDALVQCLHNSNISVYYYRSNGSCDDCAFNPGFVFPNSTEESSAVVTCLSGNRDVPFRVRSGAHSFSGTSFVEKGFIVDMKRMRRISVKKSKLEVTLGVGNRVGEVYNALKEHNFLLIGGDCPDVGIGGLASTGGTGFTTRKFGLMINLVKSYEIVTASGKAINASSKENIDLFHALRGSGGSSFGIITHVTLKVEKLDPYYGFIRIVVAKSSLAEWLQLYLSLAHDMNEDLMYFYSYLQKENIVIQGGITGNAFNSPNRGSSVVSYIVEQAKMRGINIVSQNLYQIVYENFYKFTYGADALPKATGFKSTKDRDFRTQPNNDHLGIMSGYICGDHIPIEALDELEDHYIRYPDLENADFSVNIELFGGKTFPDESYGVYGGKGCRAIITSYPGRNEEKRDMILEYQKEFWNILRPYTNYSYRGYEDLSKGQANSSNGQKTMMKFHFGENMEKVMQIKSKYDPRNLFKHHMSIPTLECYKSGNCS